MTASDTKIFFSIQISEFFADGERNKSGTRQTEGHGLEIEIVEQRQIAAAAGSECRKSAKPSKATEHPDKSTRSADGTRSRGGLLQSMRNHRRNEGHIHARGLRYPLGVHRRFMRPMARMVHIVLSRHSEMVEGKLLGRLALLRQLRTKARLQRST